MKKLRNSELNRPSPAAYESLEKIPVIVILDNIRSLHNIGSVFRTADAMLVEKIYLCGISACPPHTEIHKTALGAEEVVSWQYMESTEDALAWVVQNGYRPIGIEQTENSTALNHFHYDKNIKYALVFGHEVKGVQQEVINLCQEVIEIPQHGTKHSLNIAVSAGIVLWDFFKNLHEG